MKEIDFLPDWYKSGKRRQSGYRVQYTILGVAFFVMLTWNFIVIGSISRAEARLARTRPRLGEAEKASHEYAKVKEQIAALQGKADVLSQIDSKIDVSGVLAEISFLVGDRLALSKVEFVCERFAGKDISPGGSSWIKAAGGRAGANSGKFLGDVRFKVVISGVAADSSGVAGFICRLEDSTYFCKVHPGYSRNKQVKSSSEPSGQSLSVSEFQISCYLANYTESIVGN